MACQYSVPLLVVEMNKRPSLVGVDNMKVVLLSFGDGKVPAVGDGVVELSSRVVSAGVDSKLKFLSGHGRMVTMLWKVWRNLRKGSR